MRVEIVDGRLQVDYEGQHMTPELYAAYMTIYAQWQRTRTSQEDRSINKRSGTIFDGSGRDSNESRT